MSDKNKDNPITVVNSNVETLDQVVSVGLQYLNLPISGIFAPVNQRWAVFKNIEDVLFELDTEKRMSSFYISKFFAAVTAGLFDAALNYLWNETILQLRERIALYDIQYFFDCAIKGEKRQRFKEVDDLVKVDDSELLDGSLEIGLISRVGYNLLNHIKYMRNWASAAHPNNSELTGLQLVNWLETCIKEVICLPLNTVTIEINKLLTNIKQKELNSSDISDIKTLFLDLNHERADSLTYGLFGIYTREETTETTRNNIRLLTPDLWNMISEATKNNIGLKYAQFAVNADNEKKKLARAFLEICEGIHYIPENLREAEINEILANLRIIHNGMNNFYNEVIFAKQLDDIIGDKLPSNVLDKYVNTLVYVFLSNGYGIAESANPYYEKMIKNFDSKASMKAISSFVYPEIAEKLKIKRCQNQYLKLIDMLETKITSPSFKTILDAIKKSTNIAATINDDKFKNQIEIIRKSMK